MSASVCFNPFKQVTGNYMASFKSTDGEDYVLKYHCNNLTHEGRLTLEWTNLSSKAIRVSRYDDSKHNLFETCRISDDRTWTICFKYSSNSVVFVSITPSVRLTKSSGLTTEARTMEASSKSKPRTRTLTDKLTTDLKGMFDTDRLSDVTLTDGFDTIRAHKFMLSARSSVFEKMFQHPTKENIESKITVSDTSVEVLRELLQFMYTGTVTAKDWKMTRDLYVAADKYDVKDLVDICSSLLKVFDTNNVLEALALADLYGDESLKDSAMEFISNHYSQLKACESWDHFVQENQGLAIEILSFVIEGKL